MDSDTPLWRQVHPTWEKGDRITSQLFKPTPKDEGKLSVYDGDQITAEDSWRRHTGPGYESLGVMAVNVSDCNARSLPVIPDPETFPEHVLIDFTGQSKRRIEDLAKELTRIANQRGWVYRPPKDNP